MRHDDLLFSLLCKAMGFPSVGESEFSTLTDDDWIAIRRQAQEQTVEALCFEGMNLLPKEHQPSKLLWLQWSASVIKLERCNEILNEVLRQTADLLDTAGIHFLLMKGASAGSRYPDPRRRQCGDIDLLILDQQFEQACRLLTERGATIEEVAPEKHTGLTWQGVTIELHHTLIDLCNPTALHYVTHLDYRTVSEIRTIAGRPIRVLSPTFDSAYMLSHMTHHIFAGGLGLRQVCDWMMLMHRCQAEIDIAELLQHLNRMKLVDMFFTFVQIGVKYFHLPDQDLEWALCNADEPCADRLVQFFMESGNFGRTSKTHHDAKSWRGNWENTKVYIDCCRRFYRICPSEAGWFLLTRTWRFIKKKNGAD